MDTVDFCCFIRTRSMLFFEVYSMQTPVRACVHACTKRVRRGPDDDYYGVCGDTRLISRVSWSRDTNSRPPFDFGSLVLTTPPPTLFETLHAQLINVTFGHHVSAHSTNE